MQQFPQGYGYGQPPKKNSKLGVIAAVVGGLFIAGSCARMFSGHDKEVAQRAAAANSAWAAENEAAKKKADEARLQAESEKLKLIEDYKAKSPKQRFDAVAAACAGTECDSRMLDVVAQATPESDKAKILSEIEKQKKAAAAREAKEEAAQDIKDRAKYAQKYEEKLLQRSMNPQGVSATGTDKKTLSVRGWFCTKQWLFDFQQQDAALAKSLGFTKVECSSGVQSGSADL